MSNSAASIVVTVDEWDPMNIAFGIPKVNDRGGKAISMTRPDVKRALHVSSPEMTTWGISDWTDEKTGESNGAFKMSLSFPSAEYKTKATDTFLSKLIAFESFVIDKAVENSELWFGEELPRDVVKHSFFPFIKYSKDKVTKKVDPSKGPTISPKVTCYSDKWGIEIYDANRKMLFNPNEASMLTPMDFVPKKSKVACLLQCGGIWIGGKGWGVTWKVNQCVVKPSQVISVFGECRIPDEVCKSINNQDAKSSDAAEEDDEEEVPPAPSTHVDDSDDEVEAAPVVAAPVKKVVKKAAPAPVAEVAEPEPEPEAVAEAPKKKVVKKKV